MCFPVVVKFDLRIATSLYIDIHERLSLSIWASAFQSGRLFVRDELISRGSFVISYLSLRSPLLNFFHSSGHLLPFPLNSPFSITFPSFCLSLSSSVFPCLPLGTFLHLPPHTKLTYLYASSHDYSSPLFSFKSEFPFYPLRR